MLHPVHFSKKICGPTPIIVHKKNLVLWRGPSDKLVCFPDVCSHRGAQLSKGRIGNDGLLQCGYHGWQFDKKGICVKVPQASEKQQVQLPLACNIKPWKVVESAGIVWVAPHGPIFPSIAERVGSFSHSEHFVTDYVLDARYSYELQIENLLDPAHIHFVHNGFQGNESKAGHIKAKEIEVDNVKMTLSGVFEHTNDASIPTIRIVFHWPSVIDVSIYNKDMEVVRKNIIYVTPKNAGTCRVLFRDVAMKKFLAPPFVRMLLGSPSIEETYQIVNQEVVNAIMNQDVTMLESQQKNFKEGHTFRSLLLTESDCLIREYKRVAKRWAQEAAIELGDGPQKMT